MSFMIFHWYNNVAILNLESTICYWKHLHTKCKVCWKDLFLAWRPYWMTYVDFQNTFRKQEYFSDVQVYIMYYL